MKRLLILPLLLQLACNSAQNTVSEEKTPNSKNPTSFANSITEAELKDLLYIYASDEFEGRETGKPGQKKAVEFLKEKYISMGIPAAKGNGDYFQKVPLEIASTPNGNIEMGGQLYEIGKDVVTFSKPLPGNFEIVYAGFGIETEGYSDYKNLNVTGKFVLIKIGEPKTEDGNYVLSGSSKPSKWSNWRETLVNRLETAKQKGAAGIIYADDAYFARAQGRYQYYSNGHSGGEMNLKDETVNPAYIFINNNVAKNLLEDIETNNTPSILNSTITLGYSNRTEDVDSENVVAVLKGRSKPDEYIVISSHLDHIGVAPNGDVNNGADDDGSGTVAMLEIAQAFKKAADAGQGPERSIVFLHVTGEEKGLFGSEYYTDHPIFPLSQTVANLNIDMIGRIDPERKGNRNYIYLIGSDKLSTDLHKLSEAVNKECCNIELDYKFNDENDPNRFYYRSDHYNFAKNNIPIIFYFNGVHADYHQPSDEPDKINYDLLTNRAKLVFYTAWAVANRPERILVDKAAK